MIYMIYIFLLKLMVKYITSSSALSWTQWKIYFAMNYLISQRWNIHMTFLFRGEAYYLHIGLSRLRITQKVFLFVGRDKTKHLLHICSFADLYISYYIVYYMRCCNQYHVQQATGIDAWASRVKCPARFVSHLHEICIYIYIWVVYSFCLFCCLFIVVTWWYVWCIEWASGNQEEVQACLVTLCLFIISCYSLYKTTI